jgi:hypothetical protein
MLTIKLPIINEIDVTQYQKQYTNIVHYAYKRYQEGLTLSEVEQSVKDTMNNIELMDASLIKAACDKAKSLTKKEKVIFGGKKNWYNYIKGLITKEEFQAKRLEPIVVRGSKQDNKGNRKFALNIRQNQIIFKPKKGIKIVAEFPKTKQDDIIKIIQQKGELKEKGYTIGLSNTHVWITYDETILCDKRYNPKRGRIAAVDLNPNYIALVVRDHDNIMYKEIIGFEKLNNCKTNKKKHEDFETCKRLVEVAKHYNCEYFVYEKLDIKSSDQGKGRRLNKLCNNNWRRRRQVNNIVKRCNVIGIKTQGVIAQYSSFVGQIDNSDDYDSIAAAIELSRRGSLYIRKYHYKEDIEIKGKVIRVKEKLSKNLADRWKKTLNIKNISTYLDLYNEIKKRKYSYRNLFQFDWFSFRLKSRKSELYVFRCFS